MGNSNRKKLYSSREKQILALYQAQNKIETVSKNECEQNNQIKQQDSQLSKSILRENDITEDLEFVKQESFDEVIKDYYQYYNSLQNSNQNDSISSNIDIQEKNLLVSQLCKNLDKYHQQIKDYLQLFNLELKVVSNSQQEWANFCKELKKNQIFHQMNRKKCDQKANNQIKSSFQTIPQFKYSQKTIRQQQQNLNKYSNSATNLDDNRNQSDKDNFQPCLQRNIVSECHKQEDQNIYQRGKTQSSSIGSFLGEHNLFLFNQHSQDNKLSVYQTYYFNHYPVDDEEYQLKRDLKKFKHYMKESDEMFLLFRKVSTAFQQAFFALYGKENDKVPKEYMKEPKLLENRIQIEIRFIVRVFEKLIERIMDNFASQQQEKDIGESSSPTHKRTFMQNMDSKAFPVINMLLNFNHKVFERIRFMMQQIYSNQTKKLFTNMKLYLKNDVYCRETKQYGDMQSHFKNSIEKYKQVIPIFQKNMIEGIKIIQHVVKQVIMEEKNQSSIQQTQQKNLYQNSYLQSTSLLSPQSLAEKSQQLQASVFSLGKNNSEEINENEQIGFKQSYQIKHPIEEEDEFCLSMESNIKKAQNLVKQQQYQDQEVKQTEENFPFSNNLQDNIVQQQQIYGCDDLIPTYEYVICQAESQLQVTLLHDLKLFLLIFNNLYDRFPQYSSSISNATNFLSAYQSILNLQENRVV
ncbi:hypothetical protein TTHERM_00781020 (macronuclear) [Tetrahymena thermophila SB210]|uniref:Uncharacterized protein n=1 Tax=Tetrahymena thermophila (strain SB210) TaxID=312017 RepID=I7LXS0_TETTS|nr:hypothetical protein TTHERM_00781020 [Tetrahymena thermophila SB210]EAS06013.1 hypothetical protein TTHERM_00781020 [Tetrahymena thermophila SB210]|eukprot:XP_001026258.1 hypothetical protein TTHERM_00781020 [Tetrahymena thermophila SB210]